MKEPHILMDILKSSQIETNASSSKSHRLRIHPYVDLKFNRADFRRLSIADLIGIVGSHLILDNIEEKIGRKPMYRENFQISLQSH